MRREAEEEWSGDPFGVPDAVNVRSATARGESHAALDDPLLAQAFRFVRLDPAQGFK